MQLLSISIESTDFHDEGWKLKAKCVCTHTHRKDTWKYSKCFHVSYFFSLTHSLLQYVFLKSPLYIQTVVSTLCPCFFGTYDELHRFKFLNEDLVVFNIFTQTIFITSYKMRLLCSWKHRPDASNFQISVHHYLISSDMYISGVKKNKRTKEVTLWF